MARLCAARPGCVSVYAFARSMQFLLIDSSCRCFSFRSATDLPITDDPCVWRFQRALDTSNVFSNFCIAILYPFGSLRCKLDHQADYS